MAVPEVVTAIKTIIPDIIERKEGLDTARSFIVQAPAGSGKTELLVRRFLALLGKVQRPEQILAITFTRKAAGEMRSRIIEAIKAAKPDGHDDIRQMLGMKVIERDKELGWNILENPGRLKIQTIDSLCSSLARQMPLFSELGRLPSIAEDAEELYRAAAIRTIASIEEESRDGESVREALRHLDNSVSDLENRLVIMLASRDQWLRHIHIRKTFNEKVLRKEFEGAIAKAIRETLAKAAGLFPGHLLDRTLALGSYAAINLNEGSISALGDQTPPGSPAGDLTRWKGIACLLITSQGSWRKPGGVNKRIGFPSGSGEEKAKKKEFSDLLGEVSGMDDLLISLKEITLLPEPAYSEEEWSILKDLLHLLPAAERELKKVFAEEGSIDFQEVVSAAIGALGREDDPTDLMLALDMKILHILVDEYQDTSRTHLTLLEKLTAGWEDGDGRTVFIVGDPMQSIYLFREAEVGLFIKAKMDGINGIELIPIRLSSNFRSVPSIIDWVNRTFRGSFPTVEDVNTGSIRYEESVAVSEKSGSDVMLRLYEDRDDEEEAREAADIIRSASGEESVAIIARSRSHLQIISRVLKDEGIEFRSENLVSLAHRPVIIDLMALLRALIHPLDRVAWLSVLRAPWCGLSLQDIHAICYGDDTTPVWILINEDERISGLSGNGRARLEILKEKLGTALSLFGRISPARLLEGLWIDLGGPAFIDRNSPGEAEEFFRMVDSLAEGGAVGSSALLEARLKKLFTVQSAGTSRAVEIMTIHRAKGLEFDHVIIPGMGKRPRATEKRLLCWIERGDDLLLAPIEKRAGGEESSIYAYIRGLYKKKEDLEQTRLLYVAATRARKGLYLFGHVSGVYTDEVKVAGGSLLSSITGALKLSMIRQKTAYKPDEGPPDRERHIFRLKRLASDWQRPEPFPPLDVLIEEDFSLIEAERPEFEWAREETKHLGTVVHRYLCRIAKEGLEVWDEKMIEKEKGKIRVQLRQLGLNFERADAVSEKGAGILLNAVNDERGRWLLGSHEEETSEFALTGFIKGRMVHIVMDRVFVENGTRWIVDYKTGSHEGGSIGDFLKNERERYRDQLERYAVILKAGGEWRPIRKGLYYPAQSGWLEWELY